MKKIAFTLPTARCHQQFTGIEITFFIDKYVFEFSQKTEKTPNMASLEEDFPRGGAAKKPTESKIVVQRTEVDNLFQVACNSPLS